MARRKLDFSNADQLDEAMATVVRPSLFGDDGNDYRVLDVNLIDPNPNQPRRQFDPEALENLAASIRENRLLQPILVRAVPGGRYQLVAGERRWRATRMLEHPTIAAIVTRTDDPATLALVENLQREDLNALELANGLAVLLKQHGAHQGTLARLIGKSDAYVSRVLSILSLPPSVLDDYPAHRSKVSTETLIEISKAAPEDQSALWEAAKAGLGSKALRQARTASLENAGARPSPLHRATRDADALTKTLKQLQAKAVTLEDHHRNALLALRTTIDTLLAA